MYDTRKRLWMNLVMLLGSACVLCTAIYFFATTEVQGSVKFLLNVMVMVIIGKFSIALMLFSSKGFGQYFLARATERAEVT